MTDAQPLLVQSNSPLVITCGGCGRDVRPQFTPDGLRQLPAYCECTFLNVDPRVVDDAEPAEGANVGGDGCMTPETRRKLAIIRPMAKCGIPLREIGDALGVSHQAISYLCHHYKIPTATRKEAAQRAWRPEVRDARIKKFRASSSFERTCKHSDAFCAEIKSLKGVISASVIASRFGLVSRNAVISIWHRR